LGTPAPTFAEHFDHAGVVLAMAGAPLVEEVVPTLDAGVAKDLAAGDHREDDATEAQADPDARVSRVFALAGPARGQGLNFLGFALAIVVQGESGMQRVLCDDDWWQALRRRAIETARPYTWERCAAETLQVYRALGGGQAGSQPSVGRAA
jgi:hypothetical protein